MKDIASAEIPWMDHAAIGLPGTYYIVTVNMQHVYESLRSPVFRYACFKDPFARVTLDGRGAAYLFRHHLGHTSPILPGNQMVHELLHNGQGGKFLIIGSSTPDIIAIRQRYASVEILHCDDQIPLEEPSGFEARAKRLRDRFPGQFNGVFLALGVPKQERIAHAVVQNFNCPAYCIGGTFEMLSGRFPRAHPLLQKAGLEPVWRLVRQPSIGRITRLVLSYAYCLAMSVSGQLFARAIGWSGEC